MDAQNQQQHLSFMLGQQAYAVNILSIKEIIEHGQLTDVPMMPAFIRGVINLRGRVVPVIDLQARFGRAQTAINRRTCIVIIEVAAEAGQQEIGIMVDAVNEVIDIPADEIEPAPSFGAGLNAAFIRGMGKVNGDFLMILDLDSILSEADMAALAGVGSGEQAESA